MFQNCREMNYTDRTLDHIINDVLTVIKPQQGDWAIRFQVIDELRRVVESVESLRGATVEPYGSFVSNLFTTSGDLDISIQLSNSAYITFSGKKHKQKLLRDLFSAMRGGGWRRLQFVPQARVPILKFESSHQRISCDISVDNLEGQIKSKFLLWLGKIDGRFRDMVLLVKEWAKAHNINDPKNGTFNSYSLTLLVIFHFQTCKPSIFPPLRDIYPRNAVDDLQGVRADAERYIAETCASNIDRFTSNRSGHINRSSLSELFVSFLAKFSALSAKATEVGICPYTAQWERLSTNTRWMPKTYAMFVEDPLEQPANTARTVSSRQLARISEVFEFSYHSLISANQSPSSLLALLARPQVTQHMLRVPPLGKEYHTGGPSSNNHPPPYQRERPMPPAYQRERPMPPAYQQERPMPPAYQRERPMPPAYQQERPMLQQQQAQKIGYHNSGAVVANKVINHRPVRPNLKGSSSKRPASDGGMPQQAIKQDQKQSLQPNALKPQQTMKQGQNQHRRIWRPLSDTDNKA